jgi:dGTPase
MKYYTNWIQAKSYNSNRQRKESTQKYRNNFQKDRDRILYSKSFRRLSGKTQVFVTGQNDHFRTRLTHSLEVNQIARTISNALTLNLDLTEAIALGHDIGHTPFGHIGERTLNLIMNGCIPVKDFNIDLDTSIKGFKHNVQALRILSSLEKSNEKFDGLNMTDYTLWGIVNHTKYKNIKCKRNTLKSDDNDSKDCYLDRKIKPCPQKALLHLDYYKPLLESHFNETSWTFEGLVVRISDEIAQRHHDIEDGIFSGLINKDDIIELFEKNIGIFFDTKIKKTFNDLKQLKNQELLSSYVSRFIVNFLIITLIKDSRKNILELFTKYDIKSPDEFLQHKKLIFNNENLYDIINYNIDFAQGESMVQEYLKNKILNSHVAQSMDGKAEFIIRKLFDAFVSNPQQLPDRTLMYFFNSFLDKNQMKEALDTFNERNLIGGLRGDLKMNFERNDNVKYKHALLRTICDYISGMTDSYAYKQYNILYGSTI